MRLMENERRTQNPMNRSEGPKRKSGAAKRAMKRVVFVLVLAFAFPVNAEDISTLTAAERKYYDARREGISAFRERADAYSALSAAERERSDELRDLSGAMREHSDSWREAINWDTWREQIDLHPERSDQIRERVDTIREAADAFRELSDATHDRADAMRELSDARRKNADVERALANRMIFYNWGELHIVHNSEYSIRNILKPTPNELAHGWLAQASKWRSQAREYRVQSGLLLKKNSYGEGNNIWWMAKEEYEDAPYRKSGAMQVRADAMGARADAKRMREDVEQIQKDSERKREFIEIPPTKREF